MIDQTKYYFQSLEQNAIRQEFKYELAAHSPEDLLSYRIRSHAFTDWVSAANFREKEIAYLIMRQQYAQYGQIFDDRFSSAISIAFPPLLHSPLNKDCRKDEFKVDEVVDQLDSEGYTILPNFAPESICSLICNFYLPAAKVNRVIIEEKSFKDEIINALPNLIFNPILMRIISSYLNCSPIFTGALIFASTASKMDQASMNSDARLFHYDKDWIKWVKVFIYLSDVYDLNGPHIFVKGSRTRSEPLLRDGRFTDEEIAEAYGPENIITVTGSAGTTIIGDTSTIHKAGHVQKGTRLVLQLEYSNSLFGNPNQCQPNEKLGSLLKTYAATNPHLVRLISRYI